MHLFLLVNIVDHVHSENELSKNQWTIISLIIIGHSTFVFLILLHALIFTTFVFLANDWKIEPRSSDANPKNYLISKPL